MCSRRFSHRAFRERRKASGISLEQLAPMLGKSIWTAINYEQRRVVPPTNLLPTIAAAFSCSIDDLFEDVDEQVTP